MRMIVNVFSGGICLILATLLLNSTQFGQSSRDSDNFGETGSPRDFEYVFAEGVKGFVAELNKAGAKGYRVQSITLAFDQLKGLNGLGLSAVLKLEKGNLFEYDWFEASDPASVVTRIDYRAKRGFYFRDYLKLGDFCNQPTGGSDKSDSEKTMDWLSGVMSVKIENIFLLERKNKIVREVEHRVILAKVGLGKKPSKELERQLRDKSAQNFRPTVIFSGHSFVAILMERFHHSEHTGISPRQKAEYRVVRAQTPGGSNSKINGLAKTGFRLLFFNDLDAVMKKSDEIQPTLTYFRLVTKKESFPSDLENLANMDLMYQNVYSYPNGCGYDESLLVFSKGSGIQMERFEYITLRMPRNPPKLNPDSPASESTASGEEAMKMFDRLLSDGYDFRDLFYSNKIHKDTAGVYALFQKSVPKP